MHPENQKPDIDQEVGTEHEGVDDGDQCPCKQVADPAQQKKAEEQKGVSILFRHGRTPFSDHPLLSVQYMVSEKTSYVKAFVSRLRNTKRRQIRLHNKPKHEG